MTLLNKLLPTGDRSYLLVMSDVFKQNADVCREVYHL